MRPMRHCYTLHPCTGSHLEVVCRVAHHDGTCCFDAEHIQQMQNHVRMRLGTTFIGAPGCFEHVIEAMKDEGAIVAHPLFAGGDGQPVPGGA